MIVKQIGYLNLEDVSKLEHFSIHESHKGTHVLVVGEYLGDDLYYPKMDRLPYKTIEGKRICRLCGCVFRSNEQAISDLTTSKWNGGKQIMAYKEFCSF